MTLDVEHDHLAKIVLCQVLHYKVIPLFFSFHIVPFGGKSLYVVHSLKGGEFCSPSLQVEYPHKLFGILLHGRFVSSHLFIYSGIYLDNTVDSWVFVLHFRFQSSTTLFFCSYCSGFTLELNPLSQFPHYFVI